MPVGILVVQLLLTLRPAFHREHSLLPKLADIHYPNSHNYQFLPNQPLKESLLAVFIYQTLDQKGVACGKTWHAESF